MELAPGALEGALGSLDQVRVDVDVLRAAIDRKRVCDVEDMA